MSKFRTETDSMGALDVPVNACYGAQTQRAVNNFPVSGQQLPAPFIRALALIKQAAAETNQQLGLLDEVTATAIVTVCQQISAGQYMDQFPVDVFQTGSGTSSNMNINEVVATLASRHAQLAINANDHVNMGQSSNDVIPTAIHVSAAMELEQQLLPALSHLLTSIQDKSASVGQVVKTGRTHLMDAMPVRLEQTLQSWAGQIELAIARLRDTQPRLHQLAQGGTAVGTGINAHPDFAEAFAIRLSALTELPLTSAACKFTALATQDTAVELSGQLKALATGMMKIANDLRWMNSGPLAGLGEIELEALQPGSSIMPGKVNPVIPEATMMAAAQVIGNDTAICIGGQHGNFELNVMLPMIASNLLHSEKLLTTTSRLLADRAIATFTVNESNLQRALARNPILVTALNPIIGYLNAAEIAKKAYASGQPIIDVAVAETDLSRAQLEQLLDPASLTDGGIPG